MDLSPDPAPRGDGGDKARPRRIAPYVPRGIRAAPPISSRTRSRNKRGRPVETPWRPRIFYRCIARRHPAAIPPMSFPIQSDR